MKIHHLFESDNYGIVVTKDKSTGKFEDVDLYDVTANKIVNHVPGHAQNVFQSLVHSVREDNGWAGLESFIQQHSKSSKKLGEEYGDAENFDITLYGTFTADELGNLSTMYDETH